MLLTGATEFVGRRPLTALLGQQVRVRAVTGDRGMGLERVSVDIEPITATRVPSGETIDWFTEAWAELDTATCVAREGGPGKLCTCCVIWTRLSGAEFRPWYRARRKAALRRDGAVALSELLASTLDRQPR